MLLITKIYNPLLLLLLFTSIFPLSYCSKTENDYTIESIQYNDAKTSASVYIKYNKNPSIFSIKDYELEKPRERATVKLITSLFFEFHVKCDKIFHFTIRDRKNQRSEPDFFFKRKNG